MIMFRKAFVICKHENTDIVKNYAELVYYLLDGTETVEKAWWAIRTFTANTEFDPKTDVIIPVGKIISAFALGVWLGRKFPNDKITFGIFQDKDYHFMEI